MLPGDLPRTVYVKKETLYTRNTGRDMGHDTRRQLLDRILRRKKLFHPKFPSTTRQLPKANDLNKHKLKQQTQLNERLKMNYFPLKTYSQNKRKENDYSNFHFNLNAQLYTKCQFNPKFNPLHLQFRNDIKIVSLYFYICMINLCIEKESIF